MYNVLKLSVVLTTFYSQFVFTASKHFPGFTQVYIYTSKPISSWTKFIKHFLVSLTRSPLSQNHTVSPSPSSLLVSQPHFCCSQLDYPYPLVTKETHHYVLTRTQTERVMQSSKCTCSHLPVQVVTGILKVSEEGDRAEEFGQLLAGQGWKSAVLKCTRGREDTLPETSARWNCQMLSYSLVDYASLIIFATAEKVISIYS